MKSFWVALKKTFTGRCDSLWRPMDDSDTGTTVKVTVKVKLNNPEHDVFLLPVGVKLSSLYSASSCCARLACVERKAEHSYMIYTKPSI